jgi:phenylalanyl-tRNA synthetase beta chain
MKGKKGYDEDLRLCMALCGSRFSENWNNTDMAFDITDLRGHITAALQVMGVDSRITFEPGGHAFLGGVLDIKFGEKIIGHLGAAGQKAQKAYGIKKPVWVAEINLDACLKMVKHASVTQKELPKFPAVRRDLSLLLDENIAFEAVEKSALKRGGKLLRDVGLFDVYEGKNLPAGKKSYAIRFTLRDPNRTLDDKLIDKRMREIQKALEDELGAELR